MLPGDAPASVPAALTVAQRRAAQAEIDAATKGLKNPPHVTIGTMIETPRAAIRADEIAEVSDFFSFGTNDLTQMAFGLSRDDAGKFLPRYVEEGLFPFDPTERLDEKGVGRLLRMAAEEGRKANPRLKLGLCGEHGGEAGSVRFVADLLDYTSASPFRVLTARLAAAQAGLSRALKPA